MSNSKNNSSTPRGKTDNYQLFNNLEGYFLVLSYLGESISISAFNKKQLDGINYEINFKKEVICQMNNIFQNLTLKEIYHKFEEIMKENNYSISKKK